MHFPEIIRRNVYKRTKNGNYYADYREYYDEILEDCKERCVYCDACLKEIGGEGMHLDHFKPRKVFPHLNIPENLVLACAGCNLLKSSLWPAYGFIDPFNKDKMTFFTVNNEGEIVSKKPPANYIIDLLSLNRVSRTSIRRRREVTHRAQLLIDEILLEMDSLNGTPTETFSQRMPILTSALKEAIALFKDTV